MLQHHDDDQECHKLHAAVFFNKYLSVNSASEVDNSCINHDWKLT